MLVMKSVGMVAGKRAPWACGGLQEQQGKARGHGGPAWSQRSSWWLAEGVADQLLTVVVVMPVTRA